MITSVPRRTADVRPVRDDVVYHFGRELWELARNFGMKNAASTRVPRVHAYRTGTGTVDIIVKIHSSSQHKASAGWLGSLARKQHKLLHKLLLPCLGS